MHSPEQMRKKAEAREESMSHYNHGNIMEPREGKDHESHKHEQLESESQEKMEHGRSV